MLSRHLELEIAAVFAGVVLGPGDPVPGCGCVRCQVCAVGGAEADIAEAEDIVIVLAGLPEGERVSAARAWQAERERCGRHLRLPSPGVLAVVAGRQPGALKPTTKSDDFDRLIDIARGRPVLDVFGRLVGKPVRQGRSWQIRCPFHDDRTPSLSIDPDEGLWFCHACAFGGDAISLVMRLRHVDFAAAVRELAA